MKRIIIILIFIGLGVQGQSLDSLIIAAIKSSPAVKAKSKAFDVALKQIETSGVWADPILTGGVFILPVETRVGPQLGKIGIQQMFPFWGALKVEKSSAKLKAEMLFEDLKWTQMVVANELKSLYYSWVSSVEKEVLLEEYIASLRKVHRTLEIRMGNGKASAQDLYRTQLLIDEKSLERSLMAEEAISIENQLKALIHSDSIVLEKEWFDEVLLDNELSDSVSSEHPILRKKEFQQKYFNEKAEFSKYQRYPKLGIGLDYIFIGQREGTNLDGNGKDALMPMFSLSLPIAQKKYKSKVEAFQLKVEEANYELEEVLLYREIELESLRFRWTKISRLIELNRSQMNLIDSTLTLLKTGYANDRVDYIEVIDAEQKKINYALKLIDLQEELAILKAKEILIVGSK